LSTIKNKYDYKSKKTQINQTFQTPAASPPPPEILGR
jgi:hypothetical protein